MAAPMLAEMSFRNSASEKLVMVSLGEFGDDATR